MPWSPAQHRLFEAAAHDPKIAKSKGIPQAKAAQMASEGITKTGAPKTGRPNKGRPKTGAPRTGAPKTGLFKPKRQGLINR